MKRTVRNTLPFLLAIAIFATPYIPTNVLYAQDEISEHGGLENNVGELFSELPLEENVGVTETENATEDSGTEAATEATSEEVIPQVGINPLIAPASIGDTVTLDFQNIYDSINHEFKSFNTLVDNGVVQVTDRNFTLNYNCIEPIIFTGIPDLPVGSTLNVHVFKDVGINTPVYFAVDKGVVVNAITVDEYEMGVGAIVVAGQADSIDIADNVTFSPAYFISTKADGKLEWVNEPYTGNPTEEKVTGVIIGTYDGGQINGDITIGDNFNLTALNHGFLGAAIGAYRNATVANIVLGDNMQINLEYVQMVVGANESSSVKDITTGFSFQIGTLNAKFATIGAASGVPIDQSSNFKASTVGTIKMRQATSIYANGSANNTADVLSNVVIGSERGSYVKQIVIEEDFTAMDPSDPEFNSRFQWFYMSNSAKVSIGAYDHATIGDGSVADAISIKEATIYDSSYSPGTMVLGAGKDSAINGNINLNVVGLMTSFYSVDAYEGAQYKAAIGAADKGQVNGTIRLKAFAYSTWLDTPPTIVGPFGEGSYVKEVLIDTFVSINSYNYNPINDSIIGSLDGTIDTLRINGDMFVQLPKTDPAHGVYDFIANKIVMESGNIIGQDVSIRDGSDPDTLNRWNFYDDDTDNVNKVPPWLHCDFKMSVQPVNQFGDPVKSYTLMDMESQAVPVHTGIIKINSPTGSTYDYLYGNDFRTYIENWGMFETVPQGYIRPSWTPDIYNLLFNSSTEARPYVHFVYLPENVIRPLSYMPSQDGANAYKLADTKTAVRLSLPLDMAYINEADSAPDMAYINEANSAPEISIYNDVDGTLVSQFALNSENSSKFYFSKDGISTDTDNKGIYLVLNLSNIQELENDVLYRVDINEETLHAQVAKAELVEDFSIDALNPVAISWKFMLAPPTPITTPSPTPITTPSPTPITTPTPTPTPISTSVGGNLSDKTSDDNGDNNKTITSSTTSPSTTATITSSTTSPSTTATTTSSTASPSTTATPAPNGDSESDKNKKVIEETVTDVNNDSTEKTETKETNINNVINETNETNINNETNETTETKQGNSIGRSIVDRNTLIQVANAISPEEFKMLPTIKSTTGTEYKAKEIHEDLYMIFDMDGVPLGTIQLNAGESLDNIFIEDRLVPLGAAIKLNPKTGDTTFNRQYYFAISFIMLLIIAIKVKFAVVNNK